MGLFDMVVFVGLLDFVCVVFEIDLFDGYFVWVSNGLMNIFVSVKCCVYFFLIYE